MNMKAKGNSLSFYVLVGLIYREAVAVKWQLKLLSEGKVLRRRRNNYRNITANLCKLWAEYERGERSAKRLLKACSHVYCPNLESQ